MKFRVDRDVLGEAVAWVARELPTRPVVPVLSGLLMQAGADGLTLSCFDYEVSARVELPAEVGEPGTALVPGRLLADITRSLPPDDVEFTTATGLVVLTCGSAEFALVSLPLEEYPKLPELPAVAGTVDGGVLASAASQVVPSSSRDDTLPMLTGVNLDFDGRCADAGRDGQVPARGPDGAVDTCRPRVSRVRAGSGPDPGRCGQDDGTGQAGNDRVRSCRSPAVPGRPTGSSVSKAADEG